MVNAIWAWASSTIRSMVRTRARGRFGSRSDRVLRTAGTIEVGGTEVFTT